MVVFDRASVGAVRQRAGSTKYFRFQPLWPTVQVGESGANLIVFARSDNQFRAFAAASITLATSRGLEMKMA
jgi:hypothetical protein